MKKILLFFIALFFSNLSWAATSPFNGFYIDAGAGVINAASHENKSTQLAVIAPPNIIYFQTPNNATITKNSAVESLDIGFGRVFGSRFYGAIEARANFENNMIPHNTTLTENINNSTSVLTIGSQTNVKLKNDYALLLKPGVLAADNILLYGIIGATRGSFEISSYTSAIANNNGTPSTLGPLSMSKSSHTTGLVLGLGIDYAFTQRFSLGMEYNYVDYGVLNFPDTISQQFLNQFTLVDTGKIKYSTNSLMLRGTYRFGL